MCTRLFSKGKKYVIQDKATNVPTHNGTVRRPITRPASFLPPIVTNTEKETPAGDNVVTKSEMKKKAPLTPPPDITVNDEPVNTETVSSDTHEEKRSSEDLTEAKISINEEPTEIKIEEERRPGVIPLPVSFDENAVDDIVRHPKAPE